MMRVVVLGASGYIGRNFLRFAQGRLSCIPASMRGDAWRARVRAGADAVLCCAGVAHRRASKADLPLFYEGNCHLAVEAAQEARRAGVEQFIYLSSMSVYGPHTGAITADTVPAPKKGDHYGMSKRLAEKRLFAFEQGGGYAAIVRPPMVYGPGCPGNFPRLCALVEKLPRFPEVENRRSMIYIDNLCDYLTRVIETRAHGVFLPQDEAPHSTTDLARLIAAAQGGELRTTRLMNPAIRLMQGAVPPLRKLFGDLYYAPGADRAAPEQLRFVPFEEAVRRSVSGEGAR